MSETELILRLVLAGVLGGVIGFERQLRAKAAGVRTHILIGIGSALFMIVSKYGFADVLFHEAGHIGLDPSRIAAQVVTGVGFIGAGNIIVRNDKVRGLTTASDIWVTAALGLTIGCGMYEVGIYGMLMTLVVLEIFHRISFHFMKKNYRLRCLIATGFSQQLVDWLHNNGYQGSLISIQNNADHEGTEVITIDVVTSEAIKTNTLLTQLRENTYITEVTLL